MSRKDEFGITKDEAVNELSYVVEEAHQFMVSEFNQEWEIAEAYYAGKCDLPYEKGRSNMVKTECRDVIRALMPNIMRIMFQSKKMVSYIPSTIRQASICEQQAHWINQHFITNGGYMTVYSAALESLKMKAGPVKTTWIENAEPEFFKVTGATRAEVVSYQEMPDVIIEEVEERSPTVGTEMLYDITGTRYFENGKIECCPFPMYEFFMERDASNLEDYVHGHRRSVTVGEAIEMGLEYDNWRQLDNDNPEENDAANSSNIRRGYPVNQDDERDVDIINHEFLLTEAYCKYDMDGDGVPERYVFFLGGTTYTYLHHERVEDFCIDIVSVDPVPFTVIGRSVIDITKQSQDNETSILRAIVDNAHIANNPRPTGDPTQVNFNDLMNNAIGAPIRVKGNYQVGFTETPFTAAGLLPFLEWMERDAEMRVGVTKAARGLDPDAMQSTDKQAVLNTIELSQGQVELIVRNIIETGIIPIFRRMMRLSLRHMPRQQLLLFRGAVVPVDISMFDADMGCQPNVGLGTGAPEQKLQTLQFVYGEQKEMIAQFGLDNPFTSLSQMYNCLEDMLELGGIDNVGRYFNVVTRDMEQFIAQQQARAAAQREQQQQQQQPMDPSRALVLTEQTKSRVKQLEIMANQRAKDQELTQRSIEKAEEFDIKRDELAQRRVIELAKIGASELNASVRREQSATTPERQNAASESSSTESNQSSTG